MSEPDLVTVIIPAFDAAATIDETLRSVRAQSHRRLEIVVVDDGSTDATAEIVRGHAALDRRVRLIQQPNSGVAAARNRAIAEAAGDYLAPIDADDLWRPDRIEKQLASLYRGGENVALAYSWSAIIDTASRIVVARPGPRHAGNVLREIIRENFTLNASSALIRKAAVIEVGGYDTSLRARGAQGVEDWQLYFRIATRHEFAVVPEYLTGYRRTATGMSGDILQMLRSRDLLAEEMCRKYPEYASDIRHARADCIRSLYYHALATRQAAKALQAAFKLVGENPLIGAWRAFRMPAPALVRIGWRRLRRSIDRRWERRGQPDLLRFPIGRPVSSE
jgi:glycosyltransferase involved in cell wall biosynthesis